MKKIIIICIYIYIFIIKKTKKKFKYLWCKSGMGYCSFVLQEKKNIVLQLSEKWVGIVLQPGRKVCCNIRILGSVVLQYSGMDGLKVYCNTLVCIAGWEA